LRPLRIARRFRLCLSKTRFAGDVTMPKGTKIVRKSWTTQSLKRLKEHSRRGTPIQVISKELHRTTFALRRQASRMGIPIGERSAAH
jgi:hypothetical protein